jgi:hypothetical protein
VCVCVYAQKDKQTYRKKTKRKTKKNNYIICGALFVCLCCLFVYVS